jgi:transcriptional regulator with GAF, ATPase, and Fis domain
MTGLRFIAMHEAAVPASNSLTQSWQTRRGKGSTGGDLSQCVLVVAQSDAAALAGITAFFAAHPSVVRGRSIAVSLDRRRETLQSLLALGLGDVLEHAEADMPQTLACIEARLHRWSRIDEAIALPLVGENLVGESPAWRAVLRSVAECAMFSAAPVLITGPTGTGKELLARLLHTLDSRPRKQDLVTVDCATLATDLAGSELFGHERGAFTGAVGERDGAVALADGGTLFLDEVGELSLEHQAKLLRVLQEGSYRRVGGANWRRSEFRLVCATNRELATEVLAGRFRADLFHRITAVVCRTPSLAERREDIPALVRHVVRRQGGNPAPVVSPALLEYFLARAFGGNVRELVHLVQACLRRYAGAGSLSMGTLPEDELRACRVAVGGDDEWRETKVDDFVRQALRAQIGLKDLGRMVEAAAVKVAVAECDSLKAAASRLGVTPRALHLRRAAERDASAN